MIDNSRSAPPTRVEVGDLVGRVGARTVWRNLAAVSVVPSRLDPLEVEGGVVAVASGCTTSGGRRRAARPRRRPRTPEARVRSGLRRSTSVSTISSTVTITRLAALGKMPRSGQMAVGSYWTLPTRSARWAWTRATSGTQRTAGDDRRTAEGIVDQHEVVGLMVDQVGADQPAGRQERQVAGARAEPGVERRLRQLLDPDLTRLDGLAVLLAQPELLHRHRRTDQAVEARRPPPASRRRCRRRARPGRGRASPGG